MKYILLLIVYSFFGCGLKNNYRHRFNSAIDSASVYNDKVICLLRCRKLDSANMMVKIQVAYGDSADKYYALMYPNENPEDKKEEIRKRDCNCN